MATMQSEYLESFIVGGCVRDILLKEILKVHIYPFDWDIATSVPHEKVMELFQRVWL